MSTAERVANDTAAAIENIEIVADAAIEAAQLETERAEELAEDLAAAAMESERGRRIETLEQDVAECRSNLQSALAEIASLSRQLSELLSRVTVLEEKPAAVVMTETIIPNSLQPSPSTPTISAGETLVTTAAEVIPAEIEPEKSADENPAPRIPSKRRRFL